MAVATAAGAPPPVLALVADPRRWALLRELARSDRRVGELCELVGQPQNLVSYHLARLREAGLVSSRRSAADGRDSYYRVDVATCVSLLGEAGATLHPGARLAPSPLELAVAPGRPTPTVLFLCTGNSARSQIAEALIEHRSAGAVEAHSAGSHPKPLHPNAVRVLAERGIDIAGRPTTHLDRFARSRFDHVVTLCDKVREVCPELPGHPTTAHWSMADPAAEGPDDEASYPAFVRTADEIEQRVGLLLAQIANDVQRGGTSNGHR